MCHYDIAGRVSRTVPQNCCKTAGHLHHPAIREVHDQGFTEDSLLGRGDMRIRQIDTGFLLRIADCAEA